MQTRTNEQYIDQLHRQLRVAFPDILEQSRTRRRHEPNYPGHKGMAADLLDVRKHEPRVFERVMQSIDTRPHIENYYDILERRLTYRLDPWLEQTGGNFKATF